MTASGNSPPIGAPLNRLEDPRLLRGLGRAVVDIRRPGMIHAVFVHSPFAHAELGAIDATAAPYHRLQLQSARTQGLARDEVRYVGEPVAGAPGVPLPPGVIRPLRRARVSPSPP